MYTNLIEKYSVINGLFINAKNFKYVVALCDPVFPLRASKLHGVCFLVQAVKPLAYTAA
jgi:hypothetical protein